MKIIAAIATGLLITSCAARPSQPSEPDRYFVRGAGVWIHLRADGTWSKYMVDCFMDAGERAVGTWNRLSEDTLALTHKDWIRGIVVGVVHVSLGKEWRIRGSHVRREMAQWLKDHPKDRTFDRRDLENLGTWREPEWTHQPIHVAAESAPRSDVEGAIKAIDEFPDARDKDTIRVRLIPHAGRVVFYALNRGADLVGDAPLDEILAEVGRLEAGDVLMDAYLESTKEAFDQMKKGPLRKEEE